MAVNLRIAILRPSGGGIAALVEEQRERELRGLRGKAFVHAQLVHAPCPVLHHQ
jgi:hypothetical protein